MSPMKLRLTLAAFLILCMAAAAAAQFGRGAFGGFGRGARPKFPTAETFGRGFNFCRGFYTSVYREAGGTGWSTDYPDAELNFSIRLSELTKTRVALDRSRTPDFVVVRLTDDELFQCPQLHMEDVGTIEFSEAEIESMRAWFRKGGFLWVDDFWGSAAWAQWESEIGRVLPPSEYPIVDLPLDHPIFHSQFVINEFPQIPAIQAWRGNAVDTSERGADSAVVDHKAILDSHGNVMVFMTHNTDISDTWEREGEDVEYFYRFSPEGYAIAINVLVYVMTH